MGSCGETVSLLIPGCTSEFTLQRPVNFDLSPSATLIMLLHSVSMEAVCSPGLLGLL